MKIDITLKITPKMVADAQGDEKGNNGAFRNAF